MNRALHQTFDKKGIIIEKWLTCPHTEDEKCSCRKPNTGLIKQLQKHYDFDFKNSFMIGDRNSDILFGKRIDTAPILVKWNEQRFNKTRTKTAYKAGNLEECAKIAAYSEGKRETT